MNWFIQVPIDGPAPKVDHKSKIICLGSCFAQEIGARLSGNKFDVLVNPAGTLYHPLSIESLALFASGQMEWSEQDMTRQQGVWFSWDHHGDMADVDQNRLIEKVKSMHQHLADFTRDSNILIITLGTAFVYELLESGRVVANCHKAPSDVFRKFLLNAQQVAESLENTINQFRILNPAIQVILTVSPVRYVRDGIHQNQLSKAALLLGLEEVLQHLEGVYYFPSYEIAIDELRDYRFYTSDRVHLTEEAINYIWDSFVIWCMDEQTKGLLKQIDKILRGVGHKPRVPESEAYKNHLRQLLEQIESLEVQGVFWQEEKSLIKHLLKKSGL
jgi:hypothetical protein